MNEIFKVDIKGFQAELPVLTLPSGVKIAFFNLHGAPAMTEHCGKEIAKLAKDAEVIITAESKGLQLAPTTSLSSICGKTCWKFVNMWSVVL